jgi:hypothetical protein
VELVQNRSNKENSYVQNGYVNGTSRETSDIMDGDLHKKLLVVLSNIGYCKDELSNELYAKYRHIWSPVRYMIRFVSLSLWVYVCVFLSIIEYLFMSATFNNRKDIFIL